jgi:hypothetical protein
MPLNAVLIGSWGAEVFQSLYRLGYELDDWGSILGSDTASRPALGPIQLPIQWVQGAFSSDVKRPGREAYHSPSSSANPKNVWSCISTPQ